MYERYSQPPLSRRAFFRRVATHFGIVLIVILGSLGFGVAGYIYWGGLSPADAFLHSASLLGGLGLVEVPSSASGKLFAGIYALYSGLVFLGAAGIVFAPWIHRLLHKFHWDGQQPDPD